MWQQFIISDKQILLGKPTVKGTRISVELILELLAAGWTEQQLLESYPNLTEESLEQYFPTCATAFTKNYISPFQLPPDMFLANENFPQANIRPIKD